MLHAFATTVSLSRLVTAMKESGRRSASDHFYNFQVYPEDSWILTQAMSRFKVIFAGKTWINKNRKEINS